MLNAAAEGYLRGLVRLAQASARRAPWVLAVAVVLTAAAVYYTATRLVLDTHPDRLLDPALPYQQTERALKTAFPHLADSVVIVVNGESPGLTGEFTRRLLARLRQETGFIEGVYAPGEGEFFQRHGLLYLDRAALFELGDRLTEAAPFLGALAHDPTLRGLFTMLARALDEELSPGHRAQLNRMIVQIAATIEAQLAGQARRIAWGDDLLAGTAIGADDPQRFILVRPRLDHASLHPALESLAAIRGVVRAEEAAHSGVRVRLTGDVPIEAEELESVSQGMGLVTVLALVLVCALLVAGLRSARLVLAVLITLLVGLAWSAAFATAAIGHLNLISVTFAVLFIGLGVDFGIQFAMRYREELDAGGTRSSALARTTAGVGGALSLAAAAAAVAFFSFVPTRYWGLAELGTIAGASMFLALLANLTLLPALLALLPPKPKPVLRARASLAGLSALIARRPRSILSLAALVAIGCALLVPQARFDFDPLNMRDPTTESVATFLELLRDPRTTPYTAQVVTHDLPGARALAAQLEALPVVEQAVTLASFVPEEQEEKLALIEDLRLVLAPLVMPVAEAPALDTDAERKAFLALHAALLRAGTATMDPPEASNLLRLAQAMERLQSAPGWPDEALRALRARIVNDLPQRLAELRMLFTAGPVTLAELPPDLTARYVAPDGRARVEVYPREDMTDEHALRRFVRQVQAFAPHAGGAPVALFEGGEAVIRACLQAAALALAGTLVLLLAVLRCGREVLLILAPMGLAALLTTAASVLFDLPFNLANIIALPLLVAMTVAFGIYLVMRERAGTRVADLLDSSTPRAVLFSALTTAVAFGSMMFSDHLGMSGMGRLLALSLMFALLSTLIVLPAMMAWRPRREAPPDAARRVAPP